MWILNLFTWKFDLGSIGSLILFIVNPIGIVAVAVLLLNGLHKENRSTVNIILSIGIFISLLPLVWFVLLLMAFGQAFTFN